MRCVRLQAEYAHVQPRARRAEPSRAARGCALVDRAHAARGRAARPHRVQHAAEGARGDGRPACGDTATYGHAPRRRRARAAAGYRRGRRSASSSRRGVVQHSDRRTRARAQAGGGGGAAHPDARPWAAPAEHRHLHLGHHRLRPLIPARARDQVAAAHAGRAHHARRTRLQRRARGVRQRGRRRGRARGVRALPRARARRVPQRRARSRDVQHPHLSVRTCQRADRG